MRVGILASSLSRGGAERQACLWAAAAGGDGHDVEVLALHRGRDEYAVPPGVTVSYVEKRGALDGVRAGRQVRELATRVDVVVAFQPYLGLLCAGQPLRSPWLLVTGEDPRRFADTSRIPPRVLGAAVRRARVRVAPSRGLGDCHRALGLGESWDVVPNIVDPEAFVSGPEPVRHGVLWVGRLVPEKDPLLAVAVARAAGVPITLLGDGPLQEAVERAPGEVRRVAFTPEPWSLYRSHRALVLTSEYEAFGNVIVEALAAGTPVVAGDCDFGPREVLAGAAGSRVVPRRTGPLAEAVGAVVAAEPDPASARAHAARFSLEAVGPRIAAVLERAAG